MADFLAPCGAAAWTELPGIFSVVPDFSYTLWDASFLEDFVLLAVLSNIPLDDSAQKKSDGLAILGVWLFFFLVDGDTQSGGGKTCINVCKERENMPSHDASLLLILMQLSKRPTSSALVSSLLRKPVARPRGDRARAERCFDQVIRAQRPRLAEGLCDSSTK